MSHVAWDREGTAAVTSLESDRIALHSTSSAAPGTPLSGSVLETGQKLRVKVQRCKRVEGGFQIEGRVIDLTRELREKLLSFLPGQTC